MYMKIVLNEEELKKAISHYLATTGIRIDHDELIIDKIEEKVIDTNRTEFCIHLEFFRENW